MNLKSQFLLALFVSMAGLISGGEVSAAVKAEKGLPLRRMCRCNCTDGSHMITIRVTPPDDGCGSLNNTACQADDAHVRTPTYTGCFEVWYQPPQDRWRESLDGWRRYFFGSAEVESEESPKQIENQSK